MRDGVRETCLYTVYAIFVNKKLIHIFNGQGARRTARAPPLPRTASVAFRRTARAPHGARCPHPVLPSPHPPGGTRPRIAVHRAEPRLWAWPWGHARDARTRNTIDNTMTHRASLWGSTPRSSPTFRCSTASAALYKLLEAPRAARARMPPHTVASHTSQ